MHHRSPSRNPPEHTPPESVIPHPQYCIDFPRQHPHRPGKLIMDTGDVELYPCLRCGLVFWTPRKR